jgi:hypothetical protein
VSEGVSEEWEVRSEEDDHSLNAHTLTLPPADDTVVQPAATNTTNTFNIRFPLLGINNVAIKAYFGYGIDFNPMTVC